MAEDEEGGGGRRGGGDEKLLKKFPAPVTFQALGNGLAITAVCKLSTQARVEVLWLVCEKARGFVW